FTKQPTATEIISHWLSEMDQEKNGEIKKQFLKADKINKTYQS
ncbi:14182_t:CDS:1, partial [Gigaspora margarita]